VTQTRRASFVLIALACTVGAVFSFRSAALPARAGPRTAGTPTLRTSVWSARRIPTVLVRAVEHVAQTNAAAALTPRLTQIVAPVHACVAVDNRMGALSRVAPDTALAPASTLKLLTATAAIDLLGPGHRFTTRALTDAAGNLVIVGDGDPLLATPENITRTHADPRFRTAPFTSLRALADAIVAAGVHEVEGALLVDDHAHDTLRFLPAWKPIYAREGDVGSLGALTVDGGFADLTGTPSADPALTTGQRLAAMLRTLGVRIAGGVRRGRAAAGAREVAHVDSAPLAAVVVEMLTSSDNYTAEELLRDLAASAGNVPATSEEGTRLVVSRMAALGIPTTGLVLHDGSGLAPDDRVTCATMLKVVELASRPKFAAIDEGLPVAGRTGTLAERFVGGPLAGKLRAKTGSIAGVVGLVGVVDGPAGVRFAFLANGDFSAAGGDRLQAEVAEAVGAVPDVRPPADLVPRP
jgi:serine-type D-Ala-D-Ala carboxypeptidase/endopeptidase (penicillin-binding protein 4)